MDLKTDWKKKYLKIIGDLEAKEKGWENVESLLRKAIGRLAIAGLGIDKSLDKQLRNIQSLSRNRKDDQLSPALDKLSDILTQIDEQSAAVTAELKEDVSSIQDTLEKLMDLLQPPESYQSAINRIKQSLPNKTSEQILRELASQMNQIMLAQAESTDPELSGENDQIDTVILALLDRLSLVPGMSSKAKQIQQTVHQGLTEQEWPFVLDKIVEEINVALSLINDEKAELENFIAQVTEQLVEITDYISEGQKDQQQSLDDVESFHDQMHKDVSAMHEHMQTETDLESLKGVLGNYMSQLKTNIAEYLERGKARFQAAEQRNQTLSEQVDTMEQETQALKQKLEENNKKLLIDSLTGIRNRMAYDDHLQNMIARWERYEEIFSYCVLDIDHFKRVNDTYGHNTGDKVLTLVARIMNRIIRQTDGLFRIGGEEFVLVLPNASVEQAVPIVEKLRNAVKDSGFRYKQEKVDVTLSAGLTQVKSGDDVETLYERADEALYMAKEQGRDRIVVI